MPWSRDYMKHREHLVQIAGAFDREALRRICEMDEADFGPAFGMQTVPVAQKSPDDFYFFRDNGSSVLAVGHLDTVCDPEEREAFFVNTQAGEVLHAGGLDDRLGVYVILDLLPKLGLNYDLLLTVGEESGQSTAAFFQPPEGKEYDWIIEFDRGGTDVVMYQYDNSEVRQMVRDSGARVDRGSFSDIAYLEHLGIKAFNWGAGYQGDYHSTRGHAFLADTFDMVAYYLTFHEQNEGTAMPHYQQEDEPAYAWGRAGRGGDDPKSWGLDDSDLPVCDQCGAPDGARCARDCPFWEPDESDDDDKDFDEYPSSEAINAAIAAMERAS